VKITILKANLSLSKDPMTKYVKALFPERKNKTPLDNDCNSYVKQELQCILAHPVQEGISSPRNQTKNINGKDMYSTKTRKKYHLLPQNI
jgi:hypothetical protein